jgi:hypothetical protein
MARSLLFGVAFLLSVPLSAQEPKKDPPSPAEPKPKVSAELPGKGKITWDTKGLEAKFTVVKASHVQKPTDDPNVFESSVVWLLEAKADMTVKPGDLDVSLFDEDKVRINVESVELQGGIALPPELPPGGIGMGGGGLPSPIKVVKGERIRLVLTVPEKETLDQVKYIVVGSKAVPSDK